MLALSRTAYCSAVLDACRACRALPVTLQAIINRWTWRFRMLRGVLTLIFRALQKEQADCGCFTRRGAPSAPVPSISEARWYPLGLSPLSIRAIRTGRLASYYDA